MNKSWTTVGIIFGALTLSACQAFSLPSSKSNAIPKNVDNYDDKNYEALTTLIPPIPDSDGDGVLDDIDNCPKTPVNILVDNDGCPIAIEPIGYLMMELRVFFERNSYELRAKFLPEIAKVAIKMNAHPEQVFVLSGHTSKLEAAQASKTRIETDSKIINDQNLGRARAQVIKDALIDRGVAADRIYTFDCADLMLIAPSDTEEGRMLNQRIYGGTIQKSDLYTNKSDVQGYSFDQYQSLCQQF